MNLPKNTVRPCAIYFPLERHVRSREELLQAIAQSEPQWITCEVDLDDLPGITLPAGVSLRSGHEGRRRLSFRTGVDGVQLTKNNCLLGLDLFADPERAAIRSDTSQSDWGILEVHDVTTTGRVQLIAGEDFRSGHVEVSDLHIASADTTQEVNRPHQYGVFVKQGAFTLWNTQGSGTSCLTANLINIAVGLPTAPVYGSGIFISGAGDSGGQVALQRLETGAVYVDGQIPVGTPDQITGGVFIVFGASADTVVNRGPVTTYGPNDMALDNWGTVEKWTVLAPVKTHGPSGVGFVNFGTLGELLMEAPIETFGQGARGFNVYTGTVRKAIFDRVVTHGDGAVGIQISQPVGQLSVRRGIETFGSVGDSLVKGVIKQLPATAVSVKKGGIVERLSIQGGLRTHGTGVLPLEQLGEIREFHVEGGFAGGDPAGA